MKSALGIRYKLDGPAKAPVLLFSNSLGFDLSMWDKQVSGLQSSFQILRYDTRGHGSSDQISESFGIEDLGLDVIHLMDELTIRSAHFCGLSLGGLTGLWLAINHSQRFNAMIFSNTSAKIATEDVWKKRIELVETKGIATVALDSPARWFTEGFREAHPEEVTTFVKQLGRMSPKAYVACCKVLARTDLWSQIDQIKNEILVVGGEFDSTTTWAEAKRIASLIENSRLQKISASHISNVESENFTDYLRAFL